MLSWRHSSLLLVRLIVDLTSILQKCVVASGQALEQQFQAQAFRGCDNLAGEEQENTVGQFLTCQWGEMTSCQFYIIAKIN